MSEECRNRERTHEPDLRELIAAFDGFRDLMAERELRYQEKFVAHDEKTTLAFTMSKEAVMKAETANERRFESVNEFRKTLGDQARDLLSKAEAEARFGGLGKDVESIRLLVVEGKGRNLGTVATLSAVAVVAGIICGLVFGILNIVLKRP